MTDVDGTVLVSTRGVSRRYGGVQALSSVSLDVARGSVHALVGENGAGKSTLGKVIAGRVTPHSGHVLVDGVPVDMHRPRDALALGIVAVAQELSVMPQRTVLENVYLGILPGTLGMVSRRRMKQKFDELVDRTGLRLRADSTVGSLRLADQQKVEILRAVAYQARVIVMDEPTATLDHSDTDALLKLFRGLAAGGTSIVFVSHFLREVLEVSDRVTLMRDGRIVRTSDASQESASSLISGMLGRSLDAAYPARTPRPQSTEVALEVSQLVGSAGLGPCSLTVTAGEIVAITGLVGSGRSELARAIFGADQIQSGWVRIDGRAVAPGRVSQSMRAGMAMLPESRKSQGLLMGRTLIENLGLAHLDRLSRFGVVQRKRERDTVRQMCAGLGIKLESLSDPPSRLSGGNQQKILFGKWLLFTPRVLIADEPTRGVDVGAKFAIYELLKALSEQGIGILLISSEIEEVLGVAHRVLVMRKGRLVDEMQVGDATEDRIMSASFGESTMTVRPDHSLEESE